MKITKKMYKDICKTIKFNCGECPLYGINALKPKRRSKYFSSYKICYNFNKTGLKECETDDEIVISKYIELKLIGLNK